MAIAALIFISLSVIFAGIHANIINDGRGRSLNKKAWAALYVGIACLFGWLIAWRDGGRFNWWVVADAAAIRMVFFNIPLNRMRKPPMPFFYTTPELKNVTSLGDAWRKDRFVDYLLMKMFRGQIWIAYALCFAAAVWITLTK